MDSDTTRKTTSPAWHEKKEIAAQYLHGKSSKQLSHLYGCSPATILRILRSEGLVRTRSEAKQVAPCRAEIWNHAEEIRRLYSRSTSVEEIAARFNVSRTTVYNCLHSLGMRGNREASDQTRRRMSKAQEKRWEDREARRQQSKKLSGPNAPLYGVTGPDHPRYKGGGPYKGGFTRDLKDRIRRRDNYRCVLCGRTNAEQLEETDQQLPVHHIDGDKANNSEENLITLCSKCHGKVTRQLDKWQDHLARLGKLKETCLLLLGSV